MFEIIPLKTDTDEHPRAGTDCKRRLSTVLNPAIFQSINRLACTKCGKETNATCNCGVAYQPKPIERAKQAVKDNPEKSDRALADEIGVDHKTVAKARKSTGENSPVERIGLDGKVRHYSDTSGMRGGTGRHTVVGNCEVERGPTPGSHAWQLEQLIFHVRQFAGEMDLETLDKVEEVVRQIVAERRAKLEAKHAEKKKQRLGVGA